MFAPTFLSASHALVAALSSAPPRPISSSASSSARLIAKTRSVACGYASLADHLAAVFNAFLIEKYTLRRTRLRRTLAELPPFPTDDDIPF